MRRLVRTIAAVLLAGAALPATAYVRETTGTGAPLWWRCPEVTVRLNMTSAGYAPCLDPDVASSAAAAGLATWGQATRAGDAASCTDFSFVNGGPTTVQGVGKDGVNLVVVRNKRCIDVPCTGPDYSCGAQHNCWEWGIGTIGFTTLSWNASTGEITDADMELFGWEPTLNVGWWLTCAGPGAPACGAKGEAGCSMTDLQAVVTHEAGHMLGLDHVSSTASVMYPTVGAVAQRTLAQDDVAGVCDLYPLGSASGCVVPPKKSSGGGCASAGGVGILALLGALGVLRRPRSRRT